MTAPVRSEPRRSPSRSARAATTSSSAAACSRRSARASPRCGRGAKAVIVTDENVARHASRRRRSGARSRRRRDEPRDRPGRRSLEELSRLRTGLRGDHRLAHRARRSGRCARRRRHRRSRRLRRRGGAARARLRAGADHVAGASRFLGRRQDRDQFRPRQESDRRLPSADPGGRRYRAARHLAGARIPRRLCRGRQIRLARRRRVLLLAGEPTGAKCLPAAILLEVLRASTPSPCAAAPRPRSSRATSAKPATARCSISATRSATRWKRPAVFPTGCCTARRLRSAWRWRSSSRRGKGLLPAAEAERAIAPSGRGRLADAAEATFPGRCRR